MSLDDVSEKLGEIDLSGVAFSAAQNVDGTIGPVGAPFEKLRTAARSGVARIHTVVLSPGHRQDVEDAGLTSASETPEIYRDPNADFQVILADTVDEAIELLYRHLGPRGRIRRNEMENTKELSVLTRRVPIDQLYKELPLLRRIEPEALPRESSGGEESLGSEGKKPSLLGRLKIRRWEERMQRDTSQRYEPVTLEAAFKDFRRVATKAASAAPRFVVTGPPGSGKTTLGQFVSRKMATGVWSVGDRRIMPFRVSLRNWERWAIKNGDHVLSNYLTQRCYDRGLFDRRRLKEPEGQQLWQDWLRRGDVLLLLDGLDEITGNNAQFNRDFEHTLSQGDLRDCPVMLTCRTLSFGRHQALCERMPVFVLDGLRPEQQDDYIRAFPVEERFDPTALIDQLNASPFMRPLAANPLLLSIICFVVDDPLGVHLPATRADLYDKAIDKLLTRPDRASKSDSLPLPLARIRGLLEHAALILFSDPQNANRLTFDQQALVSALDAAAQAPATRYKDAAVSDDVMARATACGLLIGGHDSGYAFLHPTIQEFLVASALARIINKPSHGWSASLEIAGHSYLVAEIIDHKAWDPAWHEVVLLLAGRLKDPKPLLEMLSEKEPTKTNPHGDDYFRHRLALAAECLPQIANANRTKTLTDAITTELFSYWWKHVLLGETNAIGHMTEGLRALVVVNGLVGGTILLDRLIAATHNEGPSVRHGAVETIKNLGAAAATDVVLDRLLELLRDEDEDLRQAASEAIGALGPAAATDGILDGLLESLRDDDRSVCWEAAYAIGALGSAAATDDVLDRLLEALRDDGVGVRWAAAHAIGALGSAAATDGVVEALIRCQRQEGTDSYHLHKISKVLHSFQQELRIFRRSHFRWFTKWVFGGSNARWYTKPIAELAALEAAPAQGGVWRVIQTFLRWLSGSIRTALTRTIA